ncbi:nickel pincer cofactor biosynthesis protein LarB [Pseudohalioglobus lutimaris]|uniref:Circadian phase modifier CpmA n=1 Tax=Pseudohalioglobus lutimaris TaxID=1737061 RepID=A0A2N5X8D3_9GAMM|nr:nickel pincer cofactor biosynthesis protein LarB [Pseudohalioglobus lutimaris]PLW70728.1 circadian phase modifier CpmA [Pseudohalioglobus lutimaris]
MTVNYDYLRRERLGMPEAVLCAGKDMVSLNSIVAELAARPDHPVLFTRMEAGQLGGLDPEHRAALDYDALSSTAVLHGHLPARPGNVAVVTAGTSDLRVAMEAARTLHFTGVSHKVYADIGVAGLWRLTERIEEISQCDVIIVVAGMDAALASVIGGLVGKCVIGVPTSVGYGVAADGTTALNAMLASCGQGVMVTNIDNGFGAACAAIRVLNSLMIKESSV